MSATVASNKRHGLVPVTPCQEWDKNDGPAAPK
jgi:hypothetical protein